MNPQLLTVTELSQRLKIPVSTIYYWISRNDIPYIKIGKHLRFNENSVLDHFRSKTSDTCTAARTTLSDNACSLKTKKADRIGLPYKGD